MSQNTLTVDQIEPLAYGATLHRRRVARLRAVEHHEAPDHRVGHGRAQEDRGRHDVSRGP